MLASDLLLYESAARRLEIEAVLKWNDLVSPSTQAMLEAGAALEERARMAGLVTPTWADSSYLEQLGLVEALIQRQAAFAKLRTPPAADKALSRLHEQIAEFERVARHIPQPAWLSRSAAFDAIANLPPWEQIRLAQFAGEDVQARLLSFDDAETEQEKAARFVDVLNAVIEWLDRLPPSWLSRLLATKTVWLVLMLMQPAQFVLDRADDRRRDQREEAEQRAEIARDEQTVAAIESLRAAIERLTPADPVRAIWKTTLPMNLRVAPHKRAKRLAVLPAASFVEEVERAGRWMRVLYLDLDAGTQREAWIYATKLVKQSETEEAE
jgi:hypothetical protein